ncbi:hypothetical protein RDV89_07450 [Nocardioides zeae]|uniref:Uncharacterized protein n=1 Tax=Nocardioides imazamoxiresistens TaxID=3231893 RepID=A0ABU3PUK9_9ACTN|nr:hypothetical protein [Nocardioides zeae]MDT9592898.1 hypothetical protein [Nocardioides zeae]
MRPGSAQIVGFLLLLPATFALVGVLAAPTAGVELRDPIGIVGVVALVVVAARMLVVGLRAARDPHPPGTPVAEQHARTAAEEAPETVQQGVRADLAAAVDTLARRGLVDRATRARALTAPLGGLGVAMAEDS